MRAVMVGVIGCVTLAASLGAQEGVQNFASITSYVLSIPSGDTRQFITTPSWIGISWEGVWAVGRHTSAGVTFAVHDFNHQTSDTQTFRWGAVTGDQTRNLIVTAIMATGRWYPLADRTRRPHLGIETGVVYSEETYWLGASRTIRGAAHLAAAPEVGWQFPIVRGLDGLVSARYTFAVRNGDYVGGPRSNPFTTLSFGILER